MQSPKFQSYIDLLRSKQPEPFTPGVEHLRRLRDEFATATPADAAQLVSYLHKALDGKGDAKAYEPPDSADVRDDAPPLFDMSMLTALVSDTTVKVDDDHLCPFQEAIASFVNDFAGPLCCASMVKAPLCVDPVKTDSIYFSQLCEKSALAKSVKEQLVTAGASRKADSKAPQSGWGVVIDAVSKSLEQRGVRVAIASASSTTREEEETPRHLTVESDSKKKAAEAESFFVEQFGMYLSTRTGKDRLRSDAYNVMRDREVIRDSAWNAKFLVGVLGLALLDFATGSMKDSTDWKEMGLTGLFEDIQRAILIGASAKTSPEGTPAPKKREPDDPPMPGDSTDPYINRAQLKDRVQGMLSTLLARGKIAATVPSASAPPEPFEKEKSSNDFPELKKAAAAGSLSSSGKKTIHNPAQTVDQLDEMMRRYFHWFPLLQMEHRYLATTSRHGAGFEFYMFNPGSMWDICQSTYRDHTLLVRDFLAEADYKTWLLKTPSQSEGKPLYTHNRQAIRTLVETCSAIAGELKRAAPRRDQFYSWRESMRKSVVATVPPESWFNLPWLQNTIVSATKREGEEGGGGSVWGLRTVNTKDYTNATKDTQEKWTRAMRYVSDKLWDALQDGSPVPYDYFQSSGEPEIALLLALHNFPCHRNVPLASHANTFKEIPGLSCFTTMRVCVAKMNKVANTAVYRAFCVHRIRQTLREAVVVKADTAMPQTQALNCVMSAPMNLAFPVPPINRGERVDGFEMIQSLMGMVEIQGGPLVVLKRVKSMMATSVMMMCAVHKFLLYVCTMAHKVVTCAGLGLMGKDALGELFKGIEAGLDVSLEVLGEALQGREGANHAKVRSSPDNVVYGAGAFGPVHAGRNNSKRMWVDTVDPIVLARMARHLEGRRNGADHTWSRMRITSRFPASNETPLDPYAALATQLMEDLMNIAAFRMTNDGFRVDLQHKNVRESEHTHTTREQMFTHTGRALRRRMPISFCETFRVLLVCVKSCVHSILLPRMIGLQTQLHNQSLRMMTRNPGSVEQRNLLTSYIWAEQTTRAFSVGTDMMGGEFVHRVLRAHVFASTKAWWLSGFLACATSNSNMLDTIHVFIPTLNAVHRCIRKCVIAHV